MFSKRFFMKFFISFLIFLSFFVVLFFFSISEISARRNHFRVRVFGSVGYTSAAVELGNGSLLNYRASIQPSYFFLDILALGVDLGFFHAYKTSYSSQHNKNGRLPYSNAGFVHSLFLIELNHSIFLNQIGFGPYIGVQDNKNDIYFGIMIATGLEIPLTRDQEFTIPILTRFEAIFAPDILMPVNFSVGFTYRFQ